ncbi:LAETG motif-containing sortase-dependent surface protein [Streptomyces celluloflavus]|uniref:LPXTG cell wall anchor domain-containing protein n=1 Tax=Streptomyces kasugaensis TaxID=1946 RepID=A0A4V2JI49_STRKA|nr:LAETG motif-containing sortase-dependent surface protein [Streptomyces kasugaensis]TBO57211.1 hypothetical protein EYS09_23845 [Streptomyces kasugaensis]
MTARRPLLTAAAAGSVLLALWFVPSANANVDAPESGVSGPRASAAAEQGRATTGLERSATGSAETRSAPAGPATAATDDGTADTREQLLADTGGPDTTPYVVGGAVCLAVGAGLVGYSVRRTRDGCA